MPTLGTNGLIWHGMTLSIPDLSPSKLKWLTFGGHTCQEEENILLIISWMEVTLKMTWRKAFVGQNRQEALCHNPQPARSTGCIRWGDWMWQYSSPVCSIGRKHIGGTCVWSTLCCVDEICESAHESVIVNGSAVDNSPCCTNSKGCQ